MQETSLNPELPKIDTWPVVSSDYHRGLVAVMSNTTSRPW